VTPSFALARALSLVACVAFVFGWVRAASAEPHVLVLRAQPPGLEPWPEGSQAVIAELALQERQLVVRPSQAATHDALIAELEQSASDPSTVGAVAIVRTGSTGIAYVWTRSGAGVVRVQADTSLGTVAQSAVALRVTELLRARTLEIPIERKPDPAPAPAPRPAPAPPPRAVEPPARASSPGILWASGAAMMSSGADGPLPMLALGARWAMVPRLAAEASVAFPLGEWKLRTEPGTVQVSARTLALHASFSPLQNASGELSVGGGGGVTWFSTSSFATGELEAASGATRVGHVSARVLGVVRDEHLAFLLFADAGSLLPPVTLRAAGTELVRLGRTWVLFGIGIGFGP
jgi:hypothetical protein